MWKAQNTASDLIAANDCDRIPNQFKTTLWAEQDQMVKKWYSLNDPIAPAQCPYSYTPIYKVVYFATCALRLPAGVLGWCPVAVRLGLEACLVR